MTKDRKIIISCYVILGIMGLYCAYALYDMLTFEKVIVEIDSKHQPMTSNPDDVIGMSILKLKQTYGEPDDVYENNVMNYHIGQAWSPLFGPETIAMRITHDGEKVISAHRFDY